ncbi:hypothetical protein B0T20DRAFT_423636 [Sordaria brevicollis]|uniref:Uncharacterized protein n=1 Tax=Sordaria brevicollis TaxID=83679 RepID=A0AAE0U544_SORBR|nr:hypothetical protein B0T20DRAFT_423636 [Sordaria brevicollis]
MDSDNSNDSDDNSNINLLSSSDMLTLTIRRSWIGTVHRAAQAYLHQMTTSSIHEGISSTMSLASSVTEQDILYAYIWDLLTRAQIRGGTGSSSSSSSNNSRDQDGDDNSGSSDDEDCMEEVVVKLFTTINVVCDIPAQATVTVTVPLRSFFRPNVTNETGIPHLRRYALLAQAIRSGIEDAMRARFGSLTQQKGQALEVAPRIRVMAKRDRGVSTNSQLRLHIVSLLDSARGKISEEEEEMGMERHGQARREIGSDLSSLYSSWDKKAEMGVRTAHKQPTPASGEYLAVVWPESESGRREGKWRVQLHFHPLAGIWLRRTVEENLAEFDIWPRV